MKIFLYLYFTLILCSCSSEIKLGKEPEDLIPRDTMVLLLKDLNILEAHFKLTHPAVSENYISLQKSGTAILDKYRVDSTRFDKSMQYYGTRQLELQSINSQIMDEVNRELTELSAEKKKGK